MPFLYLIAIAWIFVVLMMTITESSFIAGLMTFIFYCIIPLSLVLYIFSSSARKRKLNAELNANRQQPNASTNEINPAKSE